VPDASLELVLAEVRALRSELAELLRQPHAAVGALLSTEQAAAHLGLTPAALLKRVERGQIPGLRLGRRWRFRRRDLDALVGQDR